jgi:choline-sulfatase
MDSGKQPDILVFMSDQHNARITEGAGDPYISTPNLNRLASEGTEFRNAYTSCPLCVPARASMLTGQLPSRTGILNNSGIINSEQATFVHSLAAAGYETVLCGRMHFLGPDQFHGFTKRLVGDFTPCFHGRYGAVRADLGPYVETPGGKFDKLYGGGTSPVLEYDRAVVKAALEYLAQPHDRPVFMLVGTYGPHHTYVAPPELYRKYKDKIDPPDSDSREQMDCHPALEHQKKEFTPEVIKCLRAAYYGLVEHIDNQIGIVHDAWQQSLKDRDREGVFCYISDHGDQAGEKGFWGKMSFYEESARIPLLFSGAGVRAGQQIESLCSIMDLGPTLCDLANAPVPPEQDGISLQNCLEQGEAPPERFILSELLNSDGPARMVRNGKWKYISYSGRAEEDQLFNLELDPHEYENCIAAHPEEAAKLKKVLNEDWDPEAVIKDHHQRQAHWEILSQWGREVDLPDPCRWKIPESAWELPQP